MPLTACQSLWQCLPQALHEDPLPYNKVIIVIRHIQPLLKVVKTAQNGARALTLPSHGVRSCLALHLVLQPQLKCAQSHSPPARSGSSCKPMISSLEHLCKQMQPLTCMLSASWRHIVCCRPYWSDGVFNLDSPAVHVCNHIILHDRLMIGNLTNIQTSGCT